MTSDCGFSDYSTTFLPKDDNCNMCKQEGQILKFTPQILGMLESCGREAAVTLQMWTLPLVHLYAISLLEA